MKAFHFPAALLFALAGSVASAQDFPKTPIQIVVPYAAGGNLDVTTRLIAPFLGEELGASVIVQNKPGAGGSVGPPRCRARGPMATPC